MTQPISVYNAVLPGGYQFAVLSPDGTVVFHSDTTRNLRENFFAETGQNPDLRSRVRMRSEGLVTATYIGRPHRMYVAAHGCRQSGWTLDYRHLPRPASRGSAEPRNTQPGHDFVCSLCRGHHPDHGCRPLAAQGKGGTWFWPDSRKAQQYQRVALIGLVAIVLLLLLSRFLTPSALLLFAAIIPAAGLVSAGRDCDRADVDEACRGAPSRNQADARSVEVRVLSCSGYAGGTGRGAALSLFLQGGSRLRTMASGEAQLCCNLPATSTIAH